MNTVNIDRPKLIFGVGEFARMLYNYCSELGVAVIGFTVEKEFIKDPRYQNKPVYDYSDIEKIIPTNEVDVLLGITYTNRLKLRERIYREFSDKGYYLPAFIHPRAIVSPTAIIKDSCIILEGNNIQDGCVINENTVLWSTCHIGHLSNIGPHTFISSHSVLCVGVEVGERTFIGVNVSIAPKVKIGNDCTIGMGTTIHRDVANGEIVRRKDSRDEMD